MKSSFDAMCVTINIDVIPDYVKSNNKSKLMLFSFQISLLVLLWMSLSSANKKIKPFESNPLDS